MDGCFFMTRLLHCFPFTDHSHSEGACLTQWSYELCHAGLPKTDRSQWKHLTKRGPLEEEMATHSSTLDRRIPWIVMKGQKYTTLGDEPLGLEGALGKGRGQWLIAPERMKWLGQSGNDAQLWMCLAVKESWTMKKAERQRIDAFELWCYRRLLRVPWTARRSNQSVLKEINLNIHWKDWCWKLQYFGPDAKSWVIGKDPDAGKDWRQKEKGTTEDEMVQQHHRLNGHEFSKLWETVEAQDPGVAENRTLLSDWTTTAPLVFNSAWCMYYHSWKTIKNNTSTAGNMCQAFKYKESVTHFAHLLCSTSRKSCRTAHPFINQKHWGFAGHFQDATWLNLCRSLFRWVLFSPFYNEEVGSELNDRVRHHTTKIPTQPSPTEHHLILTKPRMIHS